MASAVEQSQDRAKARRAFKSAVERADAAEADVIRRSEAYAAWIMADAKDSVGDLVGSPAVRSATTLVHVEGSIREAADMVLSARIKALEARLEAAESALREGPFKYMGSYATGTDYAKGSFVTHDGSLWHANENTRAKPGGGGYEWTLCVKRGKDGRDAR